MKQVKKVFSVTKSYFELDQRTDVTTVVWGIVESENTRNFKLLNLVAYVYSKGKVIGMGAYRPQKLINVSKKTRAIDPKILDEIVQKAKQNACKHLLTRGQVFNATILYWDNSEGQGMADVEGVGTVSIYGCNAVNSLTGYCETACITMTKGQAFTCKLADMGTHVTCSEFMGTFDQARSDELDHSKLAFLRKDNKLVKGLFA